MTSSATYNSFSREACQTLLNMCEQWQTKNNLCRKHVLRLQGLRVWRSWINGCDQAAFTFTSAVFMFSSREVKWCHSRVHCLKYLSIIANKKAPCEIDWIHFFCLFKHCPLASSYFSIWRTPPHSLRGLFGFISWITGSWKNYRTFPFITSQYYSLEVTLYVLELMKNSWPWWDSLL